MLKTGKNLFVTAVIITALMAQPPVDWTVNPSDFEYFMTVTALLEINDGPSSDTNDVVAAFVNGECRGVAEPIQVNDRLIYFLMLRANINGEIVQYLVWDANLDTVLNVTETTVFNSNDALGTINIPYVIEAINSSLGHIDSDGLAVGYKLDQNCPNPFNPITTIQYELPQRSDVQVTIYDLLGRDVTTLVSETQDAGYKSIQWDATNVSSGMYFYQIKAGEYIVTRKMLLLK